MEETKPTQCGMMRGIFWHWRFSRKFLDFRQRGSGSGSALVNLRHRGVWFKQSTWLFRQINKNRVRINTVSAKWDEKYIFMMELLRQVQKRKFFDRNFRWWNNNTYPNSWLGSLRFASSAKEGLLRPNFQMMKRPYISKILALFFTKHSLSTMIILILQSSLKSIPCLLCV